MPIDEEGTQREQAHDCSGRYTEELPECEAKTDVPGVDYREHRWVSSFTCCGGIPSNPGVWNGLGGSLVYKTVCQFCGMLKVERRDWTGEHHDKVDVIKLEPRNDTTTAWLKKHHEDCDGFIPEWLARYLGCSMSNRTTEAQAKEWAQQLGEDEKPDRLDLLHAFVAIYGNLPDQQTMEEGLLSHVYAGIK